MDLEEPWFGGVFRKPGLKGLVCIGFFAILILWIVLFLGGDIRLRLVLAVLVALAAFGSIFFNWDSLLSWKGLKPFVFYVVAVGPADPSVTDVLAIFNDPAVKVSMVELPAEESMDFLSHRSRLFKKDIDSISSSGKAVIPKLLKSYEDSNNMLALVSTGPAHVFVISAVFDTSRINQENASQMVRKAKEMAFV
jgi:hypothetical protein